MTNKYLDGIDFGNAQAGAQSAGTPRLPAREAQEGQIYFMGREIDPGENTVTNAALGTAAKLMRTPAYLDANDPFHEATVLEVQRLMQAAHGG
jgi:hypothetical protein